MCVGNRILIGMQRSVANEPTKISFKKYESHAIRRGRWQSPRPPNDVRSQSDCSLYATEGRKKGRPHGVAPTNTSFILPMYF